MAEPFLSEIRLFSFGFAPKGWATCNGQFLPINQNQALFSLLGTTFGGNGQTTFALPNLQGRLAVGVGDWHTLGQSGGSAAHTLSTSELPTHIHEARGESGPGDRSGPAGALLAGSLNTYAPASLGGLVAMGSSSVAPTGGSQAHTNMMPVLTLNYCIALQGIFPSPT